MGRFLGGLQGCCTPRVPYVGRTWSRSNVSMYKERPCSRGLKQKYSETAHTRTDKTDWLSVLALQRKTRGFHESKINRGGLHFFLDEFRNPPNFFLRGSSTPFLPLISDLSFLHNTRTTCPPLYLVVSFQVLRCHAYSSIDPVNAAAVEPP